MNEKHYDNLCEIANHVGADDAETMVMASIHDFFVSDPRDREDTTRCIAAIYNALDVFCIALDCEDEVQDMAEQAAAKNAVSEA